MTNPAYPRSTKVRLGPNVIGVHLTDTVTPSKGPDDFRSGLRKRVLQEGAVPSQFERPNTSESTPCFEVPARRPAKYLGSGDEGAHLVSCRTQGKGARFYAGGGWKGWKRRRNDLPDCPEMPSGCA
ncbi:hypothetical protein HPB52_014175 [Rhipicephalus sanguineus]|uniref:Uncharacterized protein n=1 Tax=Rhipicephalus sanguineus TaxID=34632 RepID=A0A9D4T411_RHISA|nr:hypothetical protein HPB52_014175 [Rhipicephalus sanguineus]